MDNHSSKTDELATEPLTGNQALLSFGEQANRSTLVRAVLRLSLPAIGEQFVFGLIQLVMLWMVGGLGPQAITVVGLAGQINWFLVSAFFAFGIGATALVARAKGGADEKLAVEATVQAILATTVAGLVLLVLGFVFASEILQFMGLSPSLAATGTPYLRLLLISTLFMADAACLSGALRGAGDTRTPLYINAFRGVLNLGLAYWLIHGGLGIAPLGLIGAGIATVVSTLVALLSFIGALQSGKLLLYVRFRNHWHVNFLLIRRILNVGLPAGLEQLILSGGILVFARLVTSLGTDAYAAHQIAVNITNLCQPLAAGFAVAASAFTGQALGAHKAALAAKTTRIALVLSAGLQTLIAVLFLLFAVPLVGLFTADAGVIALGALALRWAALSQPGLGIYQVVAGSLRGAGDTRAPLLLTFIGLWALRLGIGTLAVKLLQMGLSGVWLGVVVDQWVRALLIWFRFRKDRWQQIEV